jgi:hypothetical protein
MRERRDIIRQVTVAASAVFALIGAFVGSGAAGGTPIQNAAGGALAADATLIAPATPAFGVWSVIYLGLIVYAVWQLLPAQSSAERQRRVGYWIAASLVLNAFWILSIQFDLLPLSVPIIIVLLAVLVQAFLQAIAYPPSSLADTLITDATIGLYLGWVCVATAANVTALLVASGFTGWGLAPELWSLVVVTVALVVGVLLAVASRGRISPALTLAWGLCWVAVGRLAGEPASLITGVAAAIAAALVLLITIAIRFTARKALPA